MLKVNLEAQEHYSYGSIDKYAVNMDVFEALDANQKTIEIYEMNGSSYEDTIHLYSLESTLLIRLEDEATEAKDDAKSDDDKQGFFQKMWIQIKKFFTWLWRCITFQGDEAKKSIDGAINKIDADAKASGNPDKYAKVKQTYVKIQNSIDKSIGDRQKFIKATLEAIAAESRKGATPEKNNLIVELQKLATQSNTSTKELLGKLKVLGDDYVNKKYDDIDDNGDSKKLDADFEALNPFYVKAGQDYNALRKASSGLFPNGVPNPDDTNAAKPADNTTK